MTHRTHSILAGTIALIALSMTSCDAMLEPTSSSIGVSVGAGGIYPDYYYSNYPYYAVGSPFAYTTPLPPAGPIYWGNAPVAPGTNRPVAPNRPVRPVIPSSGRPVNRPVTLPDDYPVDNPVTQPIVPSRPIGGSSEPGIVMPPAGSGLTGTPTRPGGRVPASNAGRM